MGGPGLARARSEPPGGGGALRNSLHWTLARIMKQWPARHSDGRALPVACQMAVGSAGSKQSLALQANWAAHPRPGHQCAPGGSPAASPSDQVHCCSTSACGTVIAEPAQTPASSSCFRRTFFSRCSFCFGVPAPPGGDLLLTVKAHHWLLVKVVSRQVGIHAMRCQSSKAVQGGVQSLPSLLLRVRTCMPIIRGVSCTWAPPSPCPLILKAYFC